MFNFGETTARSMASHITGLEGEGLHMDVVAHVQPESKGHQDITELLPPGDTERQEGDLQDIQEVSVYPEVQSAVPTTDEDVPANTLRAWVLGLILVTIGSGLNMLFSLRNPTIYITSIVAQLIAYPLGIAWARFVPDKTFSIFGLRVSLNPGPFNKKEHTVIVVMANASFGNGYLYGTEVRLSLPSLSECRSNAECRTRFSLLKKSSTVMALAGDSASSSSHPHRCSATAWQASAEDFWCGPPP